MRAVARDSAQPSLEVQWLGSCDYLATYKAMCTFTAQRDADTADALWLCSHPAVFTQGLAGRPEHVLRTQGIPVVATNRGGQVTYHGPGQLLAYPLLDLRRRGYFVKEYVYRLEEAVIKALADFSVTGHRVRHAPGVYVRLDDPFSHARLSAEEDDAQAFPGLAKISALGVKVSRHCTLHGLALNVAMDLRPFAGINPCGYAGLQTTDLHTIGVDVTLEEVAQHLQRHLLQLL